jgi:hypothetical protein
METVPNSCIAMHGPALGRIVSIFADTTYARGGRARVPYVYATDERGTKTPPANAHVRDVYGHTVL